MINTPFSRPAEKPKGTTKAALEAIGLGFIMGVTALTTNTAHAQESRTETMNDELEVIEAVKKELEKILKKEGIPMPPLTGTAVFRKGHPYFDRAVRWLSKHGNEGPGDATIDPKAVEYVVFLGDKPVKAGKDGEVEFDREGDYGVAVLDANRKVLGFGD